MRAGLCESVGCGADNSVVSCSCGGGGVGDYTRGEIALSRFGLASVWLLLWLDDAASTKGTLRLQSPQLT
jgi:hypothetical protein